MRRSGKGSGGGAGMNKVVRKPVRTGAAARHYEKAGIAQLGQRQGDHATNKRGSTGYSGESVFGPKHPISVKLGNEVAATTVCGVGGSREVMDYGTQGTHGPVAKGNPPPAGNPLAGWERKN
jgi:hypothetical protein